MSLEFLKFSTEKLQILLEKIDKEPNFNDFQEILGQKVLRQIEKLYKDKAEEIFEKFRNHTKETIPIIINRFKKRIEEVNNNKIDAEKSIKPQYEKFYLKSLDYRSLRFKNSEKRNNNAKAFVKEIVQRKKDKLTTNNINILRGGVENAEFYITINLKFFRENISKTLRKFEENFSNLNSNSNNTNTNTNNAFNSLNEINFNNNNNDLNANSKEDKDDVNMKIANANENFSQSAVTNSNSSDILMKNIKKIE